MSAPVSSPSPLWLAARDYTRALLQPAGQVAPPSSDVVVRAVSEAIRGVMAATPVPLVCGVSTVWRGPGPAGFVVLRPDETDETVPPLLESLTTQLQTLHRYTVETLFRQRFVRDLARQELARGQIQEAEKPAPAVAPAAPDGGPDAADGPVLADRPG